MAIKVQGQTVVGDDRKGTFQVSNPGSFTTAQRDALSAVAGDQIFNTDTNKLQIYNGSQWEAAGGATTSAPSINNVVLSEDDSGGNRFTSESFTAAIDMLDDGAPISQKALKAKVTANFPEFYETEPVASNSVTSQSVSEQYSDFKPWRYIESSWKTEGTQPSYGNTERWFYNLIPFDDPDFNNGKGPGFLLIAYYYDTSVGARIGMSVVAPNLDVDSTEYLGFITESNDFRGDGRGGNWSVAGDYLVQRNANDNNYENFAINWKTMEFYRITTPSGSVNDSKYIFDGEYWFNVSYYEARHPSEPPTLQNSDGIYYPVVEIWEDPFVDSDPIGKQVLYDPYTRAEYDNRDKAIAYDSVNKVLILFKTAGTPWDNSLPIGYTEWQINPGKTGFNSSQSPGYGTGGTEDYVFGSTPATDRFTLLHSSQLNIGNWTWESGRQTSLNSMTVIDPGDGELFVPGYYIDDIYRRVSPGVWEYWYTFPDTIEGDDIFKYSNWQPYTLRYTYVDEVDGFYHMFAKGTVATPPSSATTTIYDWYLQEYRSVNKGKTWQKIGPRINEDSGLLGSPSGLNSTYLSYHYTSRRVRGFGYEFIFSGLMNSTSSPDYRRKCSGLMKILNRNNITLEGTAGLEFVTNTDAVFNASDPDNKGYWGIVENLNRSSGTLEVGSSLPYSVGDVISTNNIKSNNTSSKFLVIDSIGGISSMTTVDPGFTTLGPGTIQSITFPATFPTGTTPDDELPAGTTLQVEVEATNSSASDTYPSNVITPT